jgi:anti-anti-sigma factor
LDWLSFGPPANNRLSGTSLAPAPCGKRTIIFDLAGITAIDSTGIGSFISAYNKILSVGGEMRMAGATDHLSTIFHISQLERVSPFYTTLADAARV